MMQSISHHFTRSFRPQCYEYKSFCRTSKRAISTSNTQQLSARAREVLVATFQDVRRFDFLVESSPGSRNLTLSKLN
jgi:hypothetical protein